MFGIFAICEDLLLWQCLHLANMCCLAYRFAYGNAYIGHRVQCSYKRKHSRCLDPHATTFSIHARLIARDGYAAGRPSSTPLLNSATRNQYQDYCKKISLDNFIKEQKLYPYHLKRIQALLARDFSLRISFNNWISEKTVAQPERNRALYMWNKILARGHHNAINTSQSQYQFSLNIWNY